MVNGNKKTDDGRNFHHRPSSQNIQLKRKEGVKFLKSFGERCGNGSHEWIYFSNTHLDHKT